MYEDTSALSRERLYFLFQHQDNHRYDTVEEKGDGYADHLDFGNLLVNLLDDFVHGFIHGLFHLAPAYWAMRKSRIDVAAADSAFHYGIPPQIL